MSDHPIDGDASREEARRALDAAEQLRSAEDVRQATMRATLRPSWVDAVTAAGCGATIWASVARTPLSVLVAVGVVGAAIVLSFRHTRRLGVLNDRRAQVVRGLALVPYMVAITLAIMLGSQPGLGGGALLAVCVAVSATFFAYLRVVEHNQVKRLARGEYQAR